MSAIRILLALWLLAIAALVAMPLLDIDDTTRLNYSNACQVVIVIYSALICFSTVRAFPSESALGKVWGAIAGGTLA